MKEVLLNIPTSTFIHGISRLKYLAFHKCDSVLLSLEEIPVPFNHISLLLERRLNRSFILPEF